MDKISAEILVSGWVQGVSYRVFTQTVANRLGLAGYCQNLLDGRVLVMVEGNEVMIKELIKELWSGPPHAQVTDIQVDWKSSTGKHWAFSIR